MSRWSLKETQALVLGVKRYGTGAWRQILNDEEISNVLRNRTNVNLKDRWRTISTNMESDQSLGRPTQVHRRKRRRNSAPGSLPQPSERSSSSDDGECWQKRKKRTKSQEMSRKSGSLKKVKVETLASQSDARSLDRPYLKKKSTSLQEVSKASSSSAPCLNVGECGEGDEPRHSQTSRQIEASASSRDSTIVLDRKNKRLRAQIELLENRVKELTSHQAEASAERYRLEKSVKEIARLESLVDSLRVKVSVAGQREKKLTRQLKEMRIVEGSLCEDRPPNSSSPLGAKLVLDLQKQSCAQERVPKKFEVRDIVRDALIAALKRRLDAPIGKVFEARRRFDSLGSDTDVLKTSLPSVTAIRATSSCYVFDAPLRQVEDLEQERGALTATLAALEKSRLASQIPLSSDNLLFPIQLIRAAVTELEKQLQMLAADLAAFENRRVSENEMYVQAMQSKMVAQLHETEKEHNRLITLAESAFVNLSLVNEKLEATTLRLKSLGLELSRVQQQNKSSQSTVSNLHHEVAEISGSDASSRVVHCDETISEMSVRVVRAGDFCRELRNLSNKHASLESCKILQAERDAALRTSQLAMSEVETLRAEHKQLLTAYEALEWENKMQMDKLGELKKYFANKSKVAIDRIAFAEEQLALLEARLPLDHNKTTSSSSECAITRSRPANLDPPIETLDLSGSRIALLAGVRHADEDRT